MEAYTPLAAQIDAQPVKGEVAVVIAPPRAAEAQVDDARLTADLEAALETMSLRVKAQAQSAQAIAEVQEVLKKHSIEDATIQRPRADLEELFLRTVRESGERPGRRFSTEELAATAGKSDEGDK